MSEPQTNIEPQNINEMSNETKVSTPNVQEEQPTQLVEEIVVPEEPVQSVVQEEPVQTVVPEEPVQTVVQEEPVQTVVQEEPVQTVVQEEPVQTVVPEQPAPEQPSKEQITITIDKSTLVALSQNLNTNLIVNISAYTSVLDKLKNSETDETRKNALDANIQSLNQIKQSAIDLLTNVQTSLDVPPDQKIDPDAISKEVPGSPGANNLMNKLFSTEVAAILGTMTAATVVMLGGSRRKKMTKRRRNRGHKTTKRTKA
jgi:hypothetical protein